MTITISNGLTLVIPAERELNWFKKFDQLARDISSHNHQGGGKGVQIGTAALANNSITLEKLAAGLRAYYFGGSSIGSGDDYEISVSGYATYADGDVVLFKSNRKNTTTTPTLKINSLTAISLVDNDGSALRVGAIPNGAYCTALYDSTAAKFLLINKPEEFGLFGGTTGGTATAYTLTAPGIINSYENGLLVSFVPHVNNTTGPTIDINGLGAKLITDVSGNQLPGGALVANFPYLLLYGGGSSGSFWLVNDTSRANKGIADAAAAQSTANSALSTASSASSSASTAIADAAAAQSTADTAIINAATAQSTADAATTLAQSKSIFFGTSIGTLGSYECAPPTGVTALTDGMLVSFRPHTNNATGASLFTALGLGTGNIVTPAGYAIPIGAISTARPALLLYDATFGNFILLNASPSLTALALVPTSAGTPTVIASSSTINVDDYFVTLLFDFTINFSAPQTSLTLTIPITAANSGAIAVGCAGIGLDGSANLVRILLLSTTQVAMYFNSTSGLTMKGSITYPRG